MICHSMDLNRCRQHVEPLISFLKISNVDNIMYVNLVLSIFIKIFCFVAYCTSFLNNSDIVLLILVFINMATLMTLICWEKPIVCV